MFHYKTSLQCEKHVYVTGTACQKDTNGRKQTDTPSPRVPIPTPVLLSPTGWRRRLSVTGDYPLIFYHSGCSSTTNGLFTLRDRGFCIPQFPFCVWVWMWTAEWQITIWPFTLNKYKYFLFWNVWRNCHLAVFNKKARKFLNSWMAIQPCTTHSAIHAQTQT